MGALIGKGSPLFAPGARGQLLQDTVARPMIGGRWALMNKQETGLASAAIEYKTLDAMVAAWDIHLGEKGTDRFGEFVRIHRGPAPLALSDCDKFSARHPEKCEGHLDHRCCGDCGKNYVRCKAHGGMAGAGRSLHSHRALHHPVKAA